MQRPAQAGTAEAGGGGDAGPSLRERAELLREYAQLLQEGIIDQAEFDRVKAEILSKTN